MPSSDPFYSDSGWHSRGYLPHYEDTTVIQAITYRLVDSLPVQVVEQLREELKAHPDADDEFRRRVEEWLDAGHGSCVLRDPKVAELVVEAWQYFDNERYHLHAWVVMPNHVHVMVQMIPPHAMADAVESWKRFTATKINKMMGKSGQFWQLDYWDRYIRDENHYRAAVDYIHNNPVKAGLVKKAADWMFGSATLRSRNPL